MTLGVSWYVHVPFPGWIGSRNVEAIEVTLPEPALPPPPPPRSAEALFGEAEQAFANGRWIAAVDGYKRVLEADPGYGSAHIRWTRALINQHRLAEAVDRGRQAVVCTTPSVETVH